MTMSIRTTGTVWAVFGHRFALEGLDTKVLVDLGPKGADGLTLAVGDTLTVEGERAPCEITASRLILADGTVRAIARADKDHRPGDPDVALRLVREAGYRVDDTPIRKPRHFEIRGFRDGSVFEIHVHDDGSIRKEKPLAA